MWRRPLASEIVLLFCTLALSASVCRSGPSSCTDLACALETRGYENVVVSEGDGELRVWCENRQNRFPAAWIIEALALASEHAEPGTTVRVVALKYAQPIVSVQADAADVCAWVSGEMPTAQFEGRLTATYDGTARPPTSPAVSSLRRADLVIGPGRIRTEIGLPQQYFRAALDVGLLARSHLARGLEGSAEVYVPLHSIGDPISGDYRYEEIRPGTAALCYLRPLGQAAFSTFTFGMYDQGNRVYDNYGAVFDFRQFSSDGKWSIGFSLASIGFLAYQVNDLPSGRERVWAVEGGFPDRVRYMAQIGRRFDSVDLELTARWGRFVGGDRGWRFDVSRRFGEIRIDIYAIKSNGEFEVIYSPEDDYVRLMGGALIEIPLFPRRRAAPARFRVVPKETFSWNNRYRTGETGVEIMTLHRVEDILPLYSPSAIRANLDRVRGWLPVGG